VITGLLGNNRATIIILGGMMVAMVLMFIFAKLATAQTPSVTFAGVFLTWSVLLFFCTFLVFTATAVAVGWPVAWSEVLGLKRGGPAPLDQLASRIDYGNVGTNQDAIASLVGMAFVTTDVTEREAIVQLLKHKLAYPETRDYDTPSRLIRKALFEAIIRIRGKDLHADFANGELQNSDLVGIDLHGVNLQGTELNGSFLISTDFRTSNLRSANFTRAFLRNAFFTNADLRGAIFMDCDWFNAAGFTPEQMRDVDPKGLKRCPKASDGTYSKEAFIKKADGLYTISYSDWADEEQAEAARYWVEYSKRGGLCDLVGSFN